MKATIVATAAGGEHSILLPHMADIVWSLVAISIVAVIMWWLVLPTFNSLLDERTELIETGIANAKEAEALKAHATSQSEELIVKARAEAAAIRDGATNDAKKIVECAKIDATEEADRILANAQRQIAAEHQAAQLSLRSEVGLMAAELADKIVGEHLKDTDLTARVVDRFLADLEAHSVRGES